MRSIRTIAKRLAGRGDDVVETRVDAESRCMNGAMSAFLVLALSIPTVALGVEDADIDTPEPAAIQVAASADHAPVQAGSRGQMLYENHCMDCHESVVFIRERRTVANPAGLRATVLRWAAELKLPWGPDELDDVARYLNDAYYHFTWR